MRRGARCLAAVLAAWMISGGAQARQLPEDNAKGDLMLARFLGQTDTPPTSFVAVRRLSASNKRYGVSGWLEVRTELDPIEGLHDEIIGEGGSGYIRNKVLRKVLKGEVDARAAGAATRGALTLANYEFGQAESAGEGEIRIAILPRRREGLLINGAIVLTSSEADLLRIEGRLAKTPSFWTRRVDIVRRYERVNGVRVPVETSSTVHVLMAGVSSFTMCYAYEIINGMPVDPRIICS